MSRKWLDRINNPREGDRELLHAKLHKYYWDEWHAALKAYLKDPCDPSNAIYFLEMHPANQRHGFGSPDQSFHENMWWACVKVDPVSKHVETDKSRNTLTQFWVEWGPHMEESEFTDRDRELDVVPKGGCSSHDYRVDTGADTFEGALVNLAHNIWKLYGENARCEHDGSRLKKKDRW